MSGPITVLLTPEPALLLLSAAALRAANAIYEAHQAAQELQAQHQRASQAQHEAQQDAQAQGEQTLAQRRNEVEQRWQSLCSAAQAAGLGAELPAAPELPAHASPGVEVAYVRALQTLNERLAALLSERLPANAATDALLAEFASPAQTSLAQQLASYASQPAELRQAVQRLLARLPGPLSPELASLVAQLAKPLSPERGQALLLELRRQVQLAQATELAQAQTLVLEQSLKDLGYAVEEVADTLFVSGGVLHFAKPGWGNYMVRMRVDAQQRSANFNLIRAVQAGENERSVLDHLAEDRWCAEFPTLLAALAAQGLQLEVTRRLQAGELPVQLVERERLPNLQPESASQEQAARTLRAAPLPRS